MDTDLDLSSVMDVLSNPYLLTLIVVLTIASTVYCWIGMKRKSLPLFLIGIGIGAPTFDIMDWKLWVGSAAVVAVGFWLKNRGDNPL